MQYRTLPPPETLRDFVRFFWILESDGSPYTHRSMADGCPELIFHYEGVFDELKTDGHSEKSFTAGIHGQSQQYSRFTINKRFGIFGAYLYPFALPVLFNIPASACSNQLVDLSALPGSDLHELEERMLGAADNTERYNILTTFLEKRLLKNRQDASGLFSSVQLIIRQKGLVTVEQVAAKSGYSERQLERHFKTFSGFSPKLFSRIVRFQAALNEYGNRNKTLTEIAYDCGYYDQSHFIHEFKQFSGHHPRSYFNAQAEGTEWRS